MSGNDQNQLLDEERDQKNSTIPESLKNHIGPGSVDIMAAVGKNAQEPAELKLLMPQGTNSIEEQWAKEQEDQIHNAEMRNVENALPQAV